MAEVGRPPILDEKKKGQVCGLLRSGLGLAEAAEFVGCCPRTIKNAADEDREFADQMRQAKIQCQYQALQNMEAAAKNSWRASAWLLERCNKPRFGANRPKMVPRREFSEALETLLHVLSEEIKDQELLERVLRRFMDIYDKKEPVVNFDEGIW